MRLDIFESKIKLYFYYQAQLEDVETQLGDLWYELSGVKGIRYDKEPSSYNPALSQDKKLELILKIDILEDRQDRLKCFINELGVDFSALSREVREIAYMKYIEGKTYHQIGKIKYMSHNAAFKKLKKEVDKIE